MGDSKITSNKKFLPKLANFKEDEMEAVELITKGMRNMDKDLKSEISDGRKIDSCEDEEIRIHHKFSNSCKKDPLHKNFDFAYEIPFSSPFDYIFEFKGELPELEFLNNTRKIRKLPKHLLYTLFVNDELKQIRKKTDFSYITHKFLEFKEKGNKLYKKKKFRDAIDSYIEAYSLLNWIDTKETKKQINLMKTTTPILDDDIIITKCSVDINAAEEDTYRFYISTLLLALSYAFLELRHFSSALESLTECIALSENFLSDSYFRRSQARLYNKKSKEKDLQLAINDVKKAININPDSKIYNLHFKTLMKTIERVREFEKLRINSLLNESFNLLIKWQNDPIEESKNEIKLRNLRKLSEEKTLDNDYLNELMILDKIQNEKTLRVNNKNNSDDKFSASKNIISLYEANTKRIGNEKRNELKLLEGENETDFMLQYTILKEMKKKYMLSIKFYTETKNDEQINYAYKELEALFETYESFKWYFNFDLNQLSQLFQKGVYEKISQYYLSKESEQIDKIEKIISNEYAVTERDNHNNVNRYISEFKKIIEILKKKRSDEIFQKGNYNLDLIKFVIKKVLSNIKSDKSKKLNLLRHTKFDKTKSELSKDLTDSCSFFKRIDFSLIISIALVLLSLLMIFIHFHIYLKDLHFSKNFYK